MHHQSLSYVFLNSVHHLSFPPSSVFLILSFTFTFTFTCPLASLWYYRLACGEFIRKIWALGRCTFLTLLHMSGFSLLLFLVNSTLKHPNWNVKNLQDQFFAFTLTHNVKSLFLVHWIFLPCKRFFLENVYVGCRWLWFRFVTPILFHLLLREAAKRFLYFFG